MTNKNQLGGRFIKQILSTALGNHDSRFRRKPRNEQENEIKNSLPITEIAVATVRSSKFN